MTEITFNDVLIEPQYSEIVSRSHVDISSDMGKFTLELPVISANMRHITGAKMAYHISIHGGLGILHRFNTINEAAAEFSEAMNYLCGTEKPMQNPPISYIDDLQYKVGVSLGVQDEDKERFSTLYRYGARLFCIDVAHGHHILVKKMLHWLKNEAQTNDNIVVIAGNVGTAKGALDLYRWGADIVKVGIGPGAVCQTRKNTGVGVPQLHAIKSIREAAQKEGIDLKIISDGGIKTTGDVVKALVYADAVMVGSFIAGTSETPGDVYENPNGDFYKVYGGSASGENKVSSGKENKFVEGIMRTVPFRGHVKYVLKRIRENTQSGFSYIGAKNMKEFKAKAELKTISGGGKAESKL